MVELCCDVTIGYYPTFVTPCCVVLETWRTQYGSDFPTLSLFFRPFACLTCRCVLKVKFTGLAQILQADPAV